MAMIQGQQLRPEPKQIPIARVAVGDLVARDLSPDVGPAWAVVWRSELLPMRFREKKEAQQHLDGLNGVTGAVAG